MTLLVFGMRFLEVLFFVGIAGSAIVVVISTAEDEHAPAVDKTH
jgi:hypothetical protein